MNLKPTLVAMMIAALPGIAAAQAPDTTSTQRIDKRQETQQKRIDKGVQSGKLNEKEATRLEKRQANVQKAEDKAMADGKMTAKERAGMEHMQDKQSKKVARQKQDKQTVPAPTAK